MKKTLLLSCSIIVLFCNLALAQKNTWMVFGTGTYDNQKYSPNSVSISNFNSPDPLYLTTWAIKPGLGYMVGEHLMIGLQGGFGKEEILQQGSYTYSNGYGMSLVYADSKQTVTSWQAGVFCRYTSSLKNRFYVYTQLYAGKYGLSYESDRVTNPTTPPYYYSTPITPDGNGLLINLFPGVGMNAYHGYGVNLSVAGITYTSYNAISASNLNHFNITLGSFSFGIHKILGWDRLKTPAAGATGEAK